MFKKMAVTATSVLLLVVLLNGCFVWNSIKDRYQPYVLMDEVKEGKRKVKFVFDSPSSQVVFLAGQFNNWTWEKAKVSENETVNVVIEMERNKQTGFWEKFVYLSPGKYQYKYVLDGGTWKYDQNTLEKTDDGYGGFNSVIVVK